MPSLRAQLKFFDERPKVRVGYWHLTDIRERPLYGRYRG